MTEEPRTGSWWRTLPGVLTAVAGVITAVTGLIVAVHQIMPAASGGSTPPAASTSAGNGGDTLSGSPTKTMPAAAYRVAFPAGTRARIGDHVYEVLGTQVGDDNPGELSLRLSVRMTNNSPYPANFWDSSFRLLVNGVQRAPTGGLDDLVAGRSSGEGTVVFVVPATARRLTLLVGDREPDVVRLPLTLTPA